jgi:hypothetical protein
VPSDVLAVLTFPEVVCGVDCWLAVLADPP